MSPRNPGNNPLADLFAATDTAAAQAAREQAATTTTEEQAEPAPVEHAPAPPTASTGSGRSLADAVPPAGSRSREALESSTYLAVIRVVGVGGAGINAVERMIESDVRGVEFVAVNTDLQQLEESSAPTRLHIGADITRGLGSGANPDVGREAAERSYDHIRHLLKGSDMVFVTCGAGGGTGTGAAPVVCRAARDLGALTVAIVTTPFAFEGSRRQQAASDGLDQLRREADTIIVIPNNRLLEVLHRDVSMVEAFRVADDVLRQGVQGISDLITMPGLINVDFADVRTIMTESGSALMGIGVGTGEERAREAAQSAINSPLIGGTPHGASRILLSISGGEDLSLHEVTEAAAIIQDAASDDAEIIFGATVDDRLSGQVWVTVVATGFADDAPSGSRATQPARELAPRRETGERRFVRSTDPLPASDDDELLIPDFLR